MKHGNVILLRLMVIVIALAAGIAQGAPPIQLVWLHEKGVPPETGIRNRILAGKNIQAMLHLPSARMADGSLLDPGTLVCRMGDQDLETFVYYKRPEVAIIFARVDPGRIAADVETRLLLEAATTGGADAGTSASVTLAFSSDDLTSATMAARRITGRPIQIVDGEDRALPAGRIFGQRREDLWGLADSRGRVYLDEFTRGTPGPHYAWSPEHWTTAFDPPSSPTVVLKPRDARTTRRVDLHVTDQAGRPIAPVVLCIDTARHQVIRTADDELVAVRADAPTEVIVMAAGYASARTEIPGDADRWDVALEPVVSALRSEPSAAPPP